MKGEISKRKCILIFFMMLIGGFAFAQKKPHLYAESDALAFLLRGYSFQLLTNPLKSKKFLVGIGINAFRQPGIHLYLKEEKIPGTYNVNLELCHVNLKNSISILSEYYFREIMTQNLQKAY